MSSPLPPRMPLIQLVEIARRALQADMVSSARAGGWSVTNAQNAVFSTLHFAGSRPSDMAAMAGITRQSMGEIIRGMVASGLVELKPDPADKRAKLVVYTSLGLKCSKQGFQHISDLEQRFEDEFGPDYEAARHVLSRVAEILTSVPKEA